MSSSVYYGGTGTQIVSGTPSAHEYNTLASQVTAIQNVVGASSSDGMRSTLASLQTAVEALQTVVGDSSAGLVKDVADLKTTVGDNTGGLVKRVSDLENA